MTMRIIDVQQHSVEWWHARLGRPTASRFGDIVRSEPTYLSMHGDIVSSRHRLRSAAEKAAAKVDGHVAVVFEPSASRLPYMGQLLAEHVRGQPCEEGMSAWMQRGLELEAEAFALYELQAPNDLHVRPGGFIHDDGLDAGCSPDGRVYDGDTLVGGLELKCPSPQQHMTYWLDPSRLVAEYRHQVHGSLMLAGLPWWDLMSYHPQLPLVLVRCTPDDEPGYADALRDAVARFSVEIDEQKRRLAKGGVPDAEHQGGTSGRCRRAMTTTCNG